MDWTEISVEVKTKDIDSAAAIANMTVPYGIYIEDYSGLEDEVMEIAHVDLIDEALLQKDRDVAKIHIYIDPEDNIEEAVQLLKERLTAAAIEYKIDLSNVKEDDWLNNWRKFFKPMPIGDRLLRGYGSQKQWYQHMSYRYAHLPMKYSSNWQSCLVLQPTIF